MSFFFFDRRDRKSRNMFLKSIYQSCWEDPWVETFFNFAPIYTSYNKYIYMCVCVCVYVYRGNEMAFERRDKSIVKHVSIIYIIHRFPADNLSPAGREKGNFRNWFETYDTTKITRSVRSQWNDIGKSFSNLSWRSFRPLCLPLNCILIRIEREGGELTLIGPVSFIKVSERKF